MTTTDLSAPDKPGWALVLAGGDGTRLHPLTRRITGEDRPKQFCALLGEQTLLEQTLRRVSHLIPAHRSLVVVVRAHERLYEPLLADMPRECVVVQPENRGTAVAILYALVRLATMDVPAPVAIVPSDHYVSDDDKFMAHVEQAFQVVRARPDVLVLLGVVPDAVETEYGWVEPDERLPGPWTADLYRVRRFWEKPSFALARTLLGRGCLWNSFVTVGYPSALAAVMRRALPALVEGFLAHTRRMPTWEGTPLQRLYRQLPAADFSRHVLATRPSNLAVLPLRDVAWSDLGHPNRVTATLARSGVQPTWTRAIPA